MYLLKKHFFFFSIEIWFILSIYNLYDMPTTRNLEARSMVSPQHHKTINYYLTEISIIGYEIEVMMKI